MGNYMDTPACAAASDAFYQIAFGAKPYYRHQGWLSGRVTTDDNFTFYKEPALEETAPPVPEGDFVADAHAGMYYVSIDPSGKLGWESNQLTYVETTAHVLEVLTGKVSNAYKAFLRKLNISYIIAGEEQLDYGLQMVLTIRRHCLLCVMDCLPIYRSASNYSRWRFWKTALYGSVTQ